MRIQLVDSPASHLSGVSKDAKSGNIHLITHCRSNGNLIEVLNVHRHNNNSK